MKIAVAEIDTAPLPKRHRLVIADCIIAWGKFDSLLRAMLTAIELRNLDEGARAYNRMKAPMAWDRVLKALRNAGATDDVLATVKVRKREYDEHAKARNIIAHAGCVGTWRNHPDYLIFAPFESDAPEEMVIIKMPLDEINRATQWATGAAEMCHRILQSAGH